MTLVETWVATPAAKAFGWTLFYFLWEGAIVALALAAVLWAVRPSRIRYAAACLAMLCLLAGFGLTFARLLAQERMRGSENAKAIPIPPAPDVLAGPARNEHTVPRLDPADILPWLAPFWIAGVLLFQLRSLAGWMAARRLCRTGVCSVPGAWQEALERLGARLRLSRPVTLLESGLAGVPVVIGYLRPTILNAGGAVGRTADGADRSDSVA
jgi:bla regulator protein blaR1